MTKQLREALNYTSQQTGFSSSLIEKDYYCSLILKILYEEENLKKYLIFKGGTLLAKGYFEFFRMSEDLDFSVENSFCKERNDRRKIANYLRTTVPHILEKLNLREVSAFRGFNESTQYNGIFGYDSLVGPSETIKFEVGFRGDLFFQSEIVNLQTLLEDPFSNKKILKPFPVMALSKDEAYAEKFRAALTRKNPAIRDFFDIEKILDSGFNIFDESFIEIVKKKISFDNHVNIDLTLEKRKTLESQIITDLRPVLKLNEDFNLEKTWSSIHNLVKVL